MTRGKMLISLIKARLPFRFNMKIVIMHPGPGVMHVRRYGVAALRSLVCGQAPLSKDGPMVNNPT